MLLKPKINLNILAAVKTTADLSMSVGPKLSTNCDESMSEHFGVDGKLLGTWQCDVGTGDNFSKLQTKRNIGRFNRWSTLTRLTHG